MVRLEGNSEVGGKSTETVGRQSGKMPLHLHDGAEDRPGEMDADPVELRLEKAMIEFRAVGDKHGLSDEGPEFRGDRGEFGCRRDHFIRDPGEFDDERGDATSGLHEARPLLDDATVAHLHRSDFSDAVRRGIAAGGLEIDDDVFLPRIEGPADIGEADLESRAAQALDLDHLLTPDLVSLRLDLEEARFPVFENDEIGKTASILTMIPGHCFEDHGEAAGRRFRDESAGEGIERLIPGDDGVGFASMRGPDGIEMSKGGLGIVKEREAFEKTLAMTFEKSARGEILRREVEGIVERGEL